MNQAWQLTFVAIAVVWAAARVYAGVRLWLRSQRQSDGGCGSCGSCSSAAAPTMSADQPLVSLGVRSEHPENVDGD